MPEGLEAEIWKRSAGDLVGRRISDVWCDERVAPRDLADRLVGTEVRAVHRRGKVLVFETDGPALGLRFGMTGRLEIDGHAPIARLEYSSGADRPEWDRLRLWTTPAGPGTPALRMNDPRRLGSVGLDLDLSGLGADLLTLTAEELTDGLGRRTAPIKSALLDQQVVAGLGNLCADEVLFHAGVAPTRAADSLTAGEIAEIARACRDRLPVMLAAGGSSHGSVSPEIREVVGACPLDGHPLERSRIHGRTAVWCPGHQH